MKTKDALQKLIGQADPVRTLTTGVILSFVALIFLVVSQNRTIHQFKWILQRTQDLIQTSGKIQYLDEVLTMSARMNAATGDQTWENRYNKYEPELDREIQHAIQIAPIVFDGESVRRTNQANSKLVAMERLSFKDVRQKKPKRALARLHSSEYQKQKQIYSEGMYKFSIGLANTNQEEITSMSEQTRLTQIISVILITFLVALWLIVIQKVKRWKIELERLNSHLDQEVSKRTSELRTQEARSIESSKMATLGEMAAGIAHEINNPLTVISGKIEYLIRLQASGRLETSHIEQSLKILKKTSNRITKIVNGIKLFTRDGSNDHFRSESAKEIIEDAVELSLHKAKRNGVLIESHVDPDIKLECRSVQITQVVLNLISNAIDALENEKDPKITIQCKQVNSEIIFEVSDNGPGIPEEIQKNILTPFFTTKEVGKGTGLGLSISRNLIETHGGHLSFQSSSQGTEFKIQLPAKQPQTEVSST